MLVSFGVLIMDMFPSEKGVNLVDVKSFIPTPGGAAANVAVAAKRLGADCAFVGKVGDEQFGRQLGDILNAEGINTQGLVYDKEIRTTLNFHAVRADGSVEYLFYRNPGADMSIRAGELNSEVLRQAQVFHFDSLSLTDEPCISAVDEAIGECERQGALISFDVNYRPVLWANEEEARKRVLSYACKADIIKLNESELALFTGAGLEEGAKMLLDMGPRIVLVTLGEQGSYYASGAISGIVPAFKVDMVDPIGCGDAFISGFLTSLIKGKRLQGSYGKAEMERFCRFANAVAAMTATRYGCIPAMPSLDEVEKLLGERKDDDQ